MRLDVQNIVRKLFYKIVRRHTHGEMIKLLLQEHVKDNIRQPVFVETGSGITTVMLSEIGRSYCAKVYSCDNNREKIDELKRNTGKQLENVKLLIGDSEESLHRITREHNRIHFVFFDSAPSALHTFREFQVVEPCLKQGSCILIDNAALPNAKLLLSPCRKGKIVVSYLLASPNWEVRAHPTAGDSMISATYHDSPDYADPSYELVDYVDPWRSSFKKNLV